MSPLKDGLIVLIIVLLFFGAKRIPELSRSLGAGVKEFKTGITEGAKTDDGEQSQIRPAESAQPVASPVEHANTGSES